MRERLRGWRRKREEKEEVRGDKRVNEECVNRLSQIDGSQRELCRCRKEERVRRLKSTYIKEEKAEREKIKRKRTVGEERRKATRRKMVHLFI